MKIAPVADVKAKLSSYVEACHHEPVIVTKNGRPAAVLIPAPDDGEELERLVLAHTPRFRHLLDDAEARIHAGGGMDHADFWQAAQENAPVRPARQTKRKK